MKSSFSKTVNIQEIPMDVALSTLSTFMERVYPSFTKAQLKDRISSVDVIRRAHTLTKAGDILPDAYIVNFMNEEGFAVLGANTSIDPIIAVTETGNLSISEFNDINVDDYFIYDDSGNLIKDFYCVDDDDYYSARENIKKHYLILTMIDNAIESVGGSTPIGPSVPLYYESDGYYLNTLWGQGDAGSSTGINRYCTYNNKTRIAGCSSVALAQIMAYIHAPSQLRINHTLIDWDGITSTDYFEELDSSFKDQAGILYAGIFHNIHKSIFNNATLITPRQIQLLMERLGFVNVERIAATSFTIEMKQVVSDMLREKKPVFLSAIPKGISHWGGAHSWVVDGAMFSGETYLLHFNFGWSGTCNGYFSTSCLNPTKAWVYDDPDEDNTNSYYDDDYSWHFRLIRYDFPLAEWKAALSF